MSSSTTEPLTRYQRKLLLFLSVATFFEGYDLIALAQVLPNLREDLGLGPATGGYLGAFVNIGTILAFILVRKADVWGRRKVLTTTIIGYTLLTFVSGLAPNVWVFAVAQLVARIFLLAEWSISMVIAAEEFPASRRGMTLGVVQGCASLGSVFCAGVAPFLLDTAYGWRSVYLVGVLPLIVLMFLRRGMRETKRFEEIRDLKPPSLMDIWSTPYKTRMLKLAAVWFIAYIPAQSAIYFWKEFAVGERGFSDGDVGLALSIAAVVAMPLVFASGKLLDVVGRRRGAAIIFTIAAAGVFGCYTASGFAALTAFLTLGIFGASAYLPILNAYGSELFPTQYRGTANAWANNLLGRLGYVLSPLCIGLIVDQTGEFGPVVASTSVFSIVAVFLVYRFFPETANRELEGTSGSGDES